MYKLGFTLVILLVCFQRLALSIPAAPGGRCPANKFQCDDGSCIRAKDKCDGEPDCPDESDEFPETCMPTTTTSRPSCPANRWQCNDGSCIKSKNKCDGDLDCDDGSDELPENCVTTTTTARPPCPINRWQCDDGSCIKSKNKCDGDVDCDDGSDESPRNCPATTTTTTTTTARPTCAPNQFQCNDDSCIKAKDKCDGEPDCPDESDELPELCNPSEPERAVEDSPCNEGETLCNDGECIKNIWICDGVVNCAGGEDEDPNLCNITPSVDYDELCSPKEIQCPGGACILRTLVCDGHLDCPNGEDEEPDLCIASCTPSEYSCDNGCIDMNLLCDGHSDCQDGSDELEENCFDPSDNDLVVNSSARIELPPPRSYEDEEVIDDILNLITRGENEIDLRPDIRDLILVAGNTGAGKTTITKFLTTDNTGLESYLKGTRYLIRDREGDISTNSTLISQTIFPALMVDPETSTAFYDLPGFSDTRSPTIEIVNAYFMKKVADHAHRVKIIFVINHSSLTQGGSRGDLKLLLNHATDFIKSPYKFKSGMAVVASKVEVKEREREVYHHLGQFFRQAKLDVPIIFDDEDKQGKCLDVLDAFLTKDGGSYSRLAMFKQPQSAGKLNTLRGVQAMKPSMRKVVFENTQFVPSSPEDFGISISARAQLFLLNMQDKINRRIATLMVNMGNSLIKWLNQYIMFNENLEVSADPLLSIIRAYEAQVAFTEAFGQIQQTNTAQEFFDSLTIFNGSMIPQEVFEEIIANITREHAQLLMIHELISSTPLEFKKSEWMNPILKVKEHLDSTAYNLANAVNQRLTAVTSHIFQNLLQGYAELVNTLNASSVEEFFSSGTIVELLAEDAGTLQLLVEYQNNDTSVWGFFNSTVDVLEHLTIVQQFSPEIVSPLKELQYDSYENDFGEKPSPFEVDKWKSAVFVVSAYLNEQINNINTRIQEFERSAEYEEMMRNVTFTSAQIQANNTIELQRLEETQRALEDELQNYGPNIIKAKSYAEESAAMME